jgi:branched-subunit amino acid ABC-type transport system permease component
MEIPNFAYTSIAFASTYASLIFALMGFSPYIAIPLSFMTCGCISFLLYKFVAYLRGRGTPPVGLMISTLVFDLVIYACMNIFADVIAYFLKAYTRSFVLTEYDFKFSGVPGIFFVSLFISFTLIIIFHLLLTKTKFGIGLRAIMENYSLASVDGINVERSLGFSWFLVGGIAGIGGSLYPVWFYMDPWIGARMLISVFAACVVGGLRSIYGSLLGGFMVGASEIIIAELFSRIFGLWVWSYRAVIPIVIVCVTLFIMPSGLAGYIGELRAKRVKYD